MLRKVIWTLKAQDDRIALFEYWNNRNKTNTYSKKLNNLFKESLKIISKSPYIGKKTDIENVRAKIVLDYILFYEITDTYIVVLTIWDC